MAAAGCRHRGARRRPDQLCRAGYANAEQMISDLEAELKVKVSTSASAQAKAAKALGCRKVVVAQPYAHERDRPDRRLWHPFRLRGPGRDRLGQRRSTRSAASRRTPRSRWAASSCASTRTPTPSCCRRRTGRRRQAIDVLEREFGVNVMAAHQAIVWDALRRCGVNDRIAGFRAAVPGVLRFRPAASCRSGRGRPCDSGGRSHHLPATSG